jgi:large subunit ribosomal protein L7/L12
MTGSEWVRDLGLGALFVFAAVERRRGATRRRAAATAAAAYVEALEPIEPGGRYSVGIEAVGASKIAVIKVVRRATGLGLKEAKDVVDASPSVVRTGLDAEAATALREQLALAGARPTVAADDVAGH